MSGPPDPKPARRKIDRRATARAVLTGRVCVICGTQAATGHHVVPRGAPHHGDDVPENLVALCGSGTTGCHGDIESAQQDACWTLYKHLMKHRPDVIAYARARTGDPLWLSRRYGGWEH